MRSTFLAESNDDDDVPTLGHRRRTMSVVELDITPMIDVTFLLLIFFMVTSTMKEPATADVPPARYGVGTDSGESLVLTVMRPGADGDVELVLPDGSRSSLAELRRTDALKQLVQAAVSADPPRTHVIINADRDLPHGIVRELSRMVGDIEGVRLFLGVQDR